MKIKVWYKRSEFANVHDEWRINLPAITVSNWEEYEVELPDGFELSESNGGTMEIYDEDGKCCELYNGRDGEPRPRLLPGSGRKSIRLILAGRA